MSNKKLIVSKDMLWKALIEDLFEDFMQFFFPKNVKEIDFTKGYVSLSKELQKLYPDNVPKNRRADLLMKVYLKKGGVAWLLIHIEVQGYKDLLFPKRMYQINYRSFERFDREVIGFAILTDNDSNYHPKYYSYGRWGSTLKYEFKTYKLLNEHPKTYKDSKNPFAAAMKTAWHALERNKLNSDEALLNLKFQLLKELLSMGHERPKIRKVVEFIKYYAYFDKKDYYNKFENHFELLTKQAKTMTVEEVVIAERTRFAREEGREEGFEEGREEGREEGIEKGQRLANKTATLKMLKKGYSIEEIADILDLTVDKIVSIQKQIRE